MRLGIVGSRRRCTSGDRGHVEGVINMACNNHNEVIVISGGCKSGADHFAASYCREKGIELVEYLPDLLGVNDYYDAVKRYYARNWRIARESDVIVAFVAPNRRGGTENTIKHAQKLGKPIVLL